MMPLLYHWFGAEAHSIADEELTRQQEAIDAHRAAEFEMRNLREECDE